MTTKTTVRLICVLLCGLSLAIVLAVMKRASAERDTVRMVQGGVEMTRLLRERAGEADAIPERFRTGAAGEEDPQVVRFPLEAPPAASIYPALGTETRRRDPRKVYCEFAHFVNAPGWKAPMPFREHPNRGWMNQYSQAGFRNPYEPAETPPDLRILLCGDSHIEGVVPYEETVGALLELSLGAIDGLETVEVLNGASGGYDFYNYLGFLERSLPLEPDIYLVIVYGGNDFIGALPLHAYYKRLELELKSERWAYRLSHVAEDHGPAIAQSFHQITHFADRPQHIELALEAAVTTIREMQSLCDREGILLLTAYLPSQLEVRPEDMWPSIRRISQVFELDADDLKLNDRLADRMIAELREQGIEMVDLRPALLEEDQRLYWETDHHLNTRGQDVVARALMSHLRPLLARTRSSAGDPDLLRTGAER